MVNGSSLRLAKFIFVFYASKVFEIFVSTPRRINIHNDYKIRNDLFLEAALHIFFRRAEGDLSFLYKGGCINTSFRSVLAKKTLFNFTLPKYSVISGWFIFS